MTYRNKKTELDNIMKQQLNKLINDNYKSLIFCEEEFSNNELE